MYQRFNSRTQLHKGTKWRNTRHLAFYDVAFLKCLYFGKPWILAHLFQAEAKAIFIDRDNFSLYTITNFDVVAWIVNALPGNLRYVDEAFDTINVHESTVVDNSGHGAFDHITDFQFRKTALHIVLDCFFL